MTSLCHGTQASASASALQGVALALAWPWECSDGLGLACSGLGLGVCGLVNIPDSYYTVSQAPVLALLDGVIRQISGVLMT